MTKFGVAFGLTEAEDAELGALWQAVTDIKAIMNCTFDERTSAQRTAQLNAAIDAYNAKRREYERRLERAA